jgi:hypothetical protein
MSKNPGWHDILTAAKKFDGEFIASELAAAAEISGTDSSSATQIASAWLLKFHKWGYAAKTGERATGGPRAAITYRLTPKGQECQLQESLESRFARLLGAVKGYQDSIGKGQALETAAWKKLNKVASEVDLTA